jgi:cytidylate kinase
MLIALYGGTSTGKTTLVRALVGRKGMQARFCGDVVRNGARRLEVSIEDLPVSEHGKIDAETLDWCHNCGSGLIEGRFLDQVLLSLVAPLMLVQVEASAAARADRFADRVGRAQNMGDIARYDDEDEAFRVRAYGGRARLTAKFVLDTTALSVDECLERILAWQSELKPD